MPWRSLCPFLAIGLARNTEKQHPIIEIIVTDASSKYVGFNSLNFNNFHRK
jgi:hypothetical protein